jgi:hypothetical protein
MANGLFLAPEYLQDVMLLIFLIIPFTFLFFSLPYIIKQLKEKGKEAFKKI